jgi:hypothetical protein
MRFTGTLTSWHDERGFGSISPDPGGAERFVHISNLPAGWPCPPSSPSTSSCCTGASRRWCRWPTEA